MEREKKRNKQKGEKDKEILKEKKIQIKWRENGRLFP